jgi:glutamine synthetase
MKASEFVSEMVGEENKEKFIDRKIASADRCPRELGSLIKTSEILFHHEVTNQYLWSRF